MRHKPHYGIYIRGRDKLIRYLQDGWTIKRLPIEDGGPNDSPFYFMTKPK